MNKEILLAFNDLPALRHLNIEDVNFLDGPTPEQISIRNLKSFTFQCMSPSAETWKVLKKILRQSPSLSSLELSIRLEKGVSEDIDNLTRGSVDSPTFVPTLKSLKLKKDAIQLGSLSYASTYLRTLSYLQVHQPRGAEIPSSFWMALTAAEVRLRGLGVRELDIHCIGYALSYSGLEEIQIKRWQGEGDPSMEDEVTSKFFHCVLPKHSATLRKLGVTYGTIGPWCITESTLRATSVCKALTVLSMIYDFPSESEVARIPRIPLVGFY